MKKEEYKNDLQSIMKKSSEILLSKKSYDVVSSIGRDIKLQGDLLSNINIIEGLNKISSFPILSEETGWNEGNQKDAKLGKHWIVDPLDGTYNFARNIPFFGICIALWENESPLLGTYFDIPNNKFYYGEVGVPSHDLKVSTVDQVEQSVLSTGFPGRLDLDQADGKMYLDQMKRFKKVRMLGSAAASLALVAEGKVDVHYERSSMIWDVASGIAMVLAAGGEVVYKLLDQNRINIIASNRLLAPNLNFITDTL